MDDVIVAARRTQAGWAALPLPARLRVIRRLRRSLGRAPDALADSVPLHGRRTPGETLALELLPLLDACRFLERAAPALLRPRRLGAAGRPGWLFGARAEIRREPLGLVLVVAPGNYPLLLPGVQAVQALVAGNAVLVKPAPGGTGPMALLGAALRDAGLPDGLFTVLGEEVAAVRGAVAAGVDKLLLTGSAATGRQVLADLAPHLTPACLELSGCDPVFVLPDADPGFVARALAFGLRLNGGATCIAPRRVFVPRTLAPDLETALAALLPDLPAVPLSPAVAAQAGRLLAEAAGAGARILGGGAPRPDGMLAPTVAVVPDAGPAGPGLLRADLFAPVLSLIPVADTAEALVRAADCPYALGAAVFGPERQALDLARRVRAGAVTVNDLVVPTADPRLPFGGRGESGFGTTRGAEGLLELTVPKAIIARPGRFRPHYAPWRSTDSALLRGYIALVHGGAGAVLGILRKTLSRGERG